MNNLSTFAGECTLAPPFFLVRQVRSGVRCRVHYGGRIRLRNRGCSRVVRANNNVTAQQRIRKLFGLWGSAELSRRQESTENGAYATTSLGSQRAVDSTFDEKEGARVFCQHVTLCNRGGFLASTTTLKNANDLLEQPAQIVGMLHHGFTAMARHPGRAMAC